MEVRKMRGYSLNLVAAIILSLLLVMAMLPETAFADTAADGSITVNLVIKNNTFTQPLKNLDGQTVTPAWVGTLSSSAIKVTVPSGGSLGAAVKETLGDVAGGDAVYISGVAGLFAGINVEQTGTEWSSYDSSGFLFFLNGGSPQLGVGYGAGMNDCVNSTTVDPNTQYKLNDDDNVLLAYSVDGTEAERPYISAPSNVKITSLGAKAALINWSKNDKATGYEIYRSTKRNGKFVKIATPKTNTYKDCKLVSATSYFYKIKMIRNQNTSSFSKVGKITTSPTKPVIKVTKKNKKSLKVSWKKVKRADQYQIYRATKKTGKYKKMKTASAKTLSWTNKKLKKGKKYFYKVRAVKRIDGKKIYSAFSTVKFNKR